ncbi:hypothetical protein GOP47_0020524 [Adiantum capillus-veneris]|uniref:DYW domain-containing protein n=1 Tax=Adiantum capillus-veneris TaxID=13818 RepID=A0A9D4UAY2_ADICA|nr:hypothetical protein GOP47_0020524 [Adiantum capillus-veneris]
MLRPMLRRSVEANPQVVVGALLQAGARSLHTKPWGDDFFKMADSMFTPCLDEEQHSHMYSRDMDDVAPASALPVHEGCGSMTGSTPLQPSTKLWAPLSCGCSTHNHTRSTVSPAPRMGPLSSTGSIMLSNSYASSSRFEDKAKIRALMEARGLKKEPGWSRIEIQDLRCVLRDIPESEKEHALQHHSERLAMALGHISLPPRAPMRVIKNLRVCNDCHVATKYFAYIYKREIIVRDATRFHHFKEGFCSCGDYW